jgi:hypothetical protein
MGRAFSMYEGEEVHIRFWWENLRQGNRLEDQGLNEIILLNCILEKWNGGMDWIDLTQDRHSWPGLVNKVMNLHVP